MLREDRFYIVSPIDILLAQKRDMADHIDWLLQKKDFEVQYVVLCACMTCTLYISNMITSCPCDKEGV